MPKLPLLTGNELIRILESHGLRIHRIKGSHFRLISDDGRCVTVPSHGAKTIPKGLLRKIIREDLEISLEEFLNWVEKS